MNLNIKILVLSFILLAFSCKKDAGNKKVESNDNIYHENYDNGKKKIRAQIKNNKYNGKYTLFTEDGNKIEEGLMKEGNKIGYWKYFNKKNKLIKVERVINDSLKYDMEVSDFINKKIHIPEYSFNIEVPKAWTIRTSFEEEGVLLNIVKICESNRRFCPVMSISTEKLPDSISLREFVDLSRKMLPSLYDKFKEVELEEIKVNDLESYRLSYHAMAQGLLLGGSVSWVKSKDDVFMVTSLAQNDKGYKDFLKYRLLFGEIVQSIKID